MGLLIGWGFCYLLINLGLLALGIVLGFLTHKIFPSIDLGSSVIAAVVSTVASIHYFMRLMQFGSDELDRRERFKEPEDPEEFDAEDPDFPIPMRTRRRHGRRK
ncbi:hypothetical protein ACYOEI_30950 [Singulisphaera rosea]